MLFSLKIYIQDLLNKEDKKLTVLNYEKYIEPIQQKRLVDTIFYKEYISKFPDLDYHVSEEFKEVFDFKLLGKFVMASMSSEGRIEYLEETKKSELIIKVFAEGQHMEKRVSELRDFQILRLFEIYIEEQMNMEVIKAREKQEVDAIMAQRKLHLHNAERMKIISDKNKFLYS